MTSCEYFNMYFYYYSSFNQQFCDHRRVRGFARGEIQFMLKSILHLLPVFFATHTATLKFNNEKSLRSLQFVYIVCL
jgi:hypothetical protein